MAESPFTKPEMITKPRTTRLTPVKILFTRADSFTPKARSPEGSNRRDVTETRRFHIAAPLTTCPAMWVEVWKLHNVKLTISQQHHHTNEFYCHATLVAILV